jgi:hypothetical protein
MKKNITRPTLRFALVLAHLLEEDRRELDPHHDDVERDADRHLEHHRVGIDRPGPEHVPDVPPAAEVEDDPGGGQRVAEQAGQQRRAHQRVVFALVEDVDQHRHREAAAGEGRADHHIDHHPDAPGIAVVETGHGAEAEQEAHHQDRRHQRDEDAAGQRHRIDQAAADRGGRRMIDWAMISSPPCRTRHRPA